MQEIGCFKIQTHYKKSCSEKMASEENFQSEAQKTHQQKPKSWVCHGEEQRVLSQPWGAASAPHPKGKRAMHTGAEQQRSLFRKKNISFNLELTSLFILRLESIFNRLKIRLMQIGSLYTNTRVHNTSQF